MKNFAEFRILGRVGKIKQFDGKVNVTVCAIIRQEGRRDARKSALERGLNLLGGGSRLRDEIRQGRRPGSGPGPHEAEHACVSGAITATSFESAMFAKTRRLCGSISRASGCVGTGRFATSVKLSVFTTAIRAGFAALLPP